MFIILFKLIVRQAVRRGKSSVALAGLLLAAAAGASLVASSLAGGLQAQATASARHAIVISVDGLGASWYTAPPPNLRIPHLRRLIEEGSYAEGVVGVYPSVTYPSHTTIVTGRPPAEHGVYSNLSSREAGKNPHDWFWFASAIRVPALWDEVHRAGLTSAAVSWPVTVGAAIDWNVPEVWDPQKGSQLDLEYVAKHATPGLVAEALQALGPLDADEDTLRTQLAIHLLKRYQPNLLLVHLAALDGAEHDHGPRSPEAIATLERADARIGELLAAVKEAGLEGATDVFVVSDHGFLPVEREIQPNVLLAKAGLLQTDARGSITGGKVATVANGGSFFIYWPAGDDLRSQVDGALKPLRDEGALWGVLSREALADLGAEPAIQMALEAPSGAGFDGRASGELVVKMEKLGGTHGYLPFRPNLEAAFIAWGPRIRRGVNLHRIPMTAVGPTILQSLGIGGAQFGTHPPLADILE